MTGQGAARLLTLVSSARPADVPGILSLIPEPDLVEGLADPASEVCVVAAEHLALTGSDRVARILRDRGVAGLGDRSRASAAIRDSRPTASVHEVRRTAMLRQLERGALRGSDLILQGTPAAATVVLAGHDYPSPSEGEPLDRAKWGRADAARTLRRLVDERLGSDLDAWQRMLSRLDIHLGSFHDLLDAPPGGGLPRSAPYWQGLWTVNAAASLLLAAASPSVARWAFTDERLQLHCHFDVERAMTAEPPLTRVVVEQILPSAASATALRRLAANPATPESVQRRMLAVSGVPADVVGRIYANGDERSRTEMIRNGVLDPEPFGAALPDLPDAAVAPVLASEDAAWLHTVVRSANSHLSHETRLRLYGRLAELAGPEPVWALETARAGSVADAVGPVRASMAAGSIQPLLDAAAAAPVDPEPPHDDQTSAVLCSRLEALLDAPVAWPLEDLIHARLDGRPERWRTVVRWLVAGSADPVEDLILASSARSG